MFQQRKPKQFNYQSRFKEEDKKSTEFKSQLADVYKREKPKSSIKFSSVFTLVVLLILVVIVMFYLESKAS